MAFPPNKIPPDSGTRTAPSEMTPAFSRNARAFGGKRGVGRKAKPVGGAMAFLKGLQGK